MPNHIKNRLTLSGKLNDLDAMIKQFGTYHHAEIAETHDKTKVICKKSGNEWGFMWFDLKTGISEDRNNGQQNGLPEGYEIKINDSFLAFPDFEKVIPPPDTDAYKDLPTQDAVKDSPDWWYTWNCNNWGTKWGGYSYERPAINVFEFETAWASAPRIVEKMSLAFPNITIEYAWADEDTGHNCGRAVYHNGLLNSDTPEGGTKEAYEIAFDLRPDRRENYELVDGEYKYKEEETEA